jgi:hypothetical protein
VTSTADVLREAAAEARLAKSTYEAAAARRDALARKMRDEGATLEAIAEAAGLSAMAISKQLRRPTLGS